MFDLLDPYYIGFEDEERPLSEQEAQEEIEEVLDAWTREARAEYEAQRGLEDDLWARCTGTANADILYDSGL